VFSQSDHHSSREGFKHQLTRYENSDKRYQDDYNLCHNANSLIYLGFHKLLNFKQLLETPESLTLTGTPGVKMKPLGSKIPPSHFSDKKGITPELETSIVSESIQVTVTGKLFNSVSCSTRRALGDPMRR
jgi:hypothetical protein